MSRNHPVIALLFAVSLLLAIACGGSAPTLEPTSTPTATVTPFPTATPAPTNTPEPMPTEVPTPSPVPTLPPVVVADELAIGGQQHFFLDVPPTIALTPMEELVAIMCDPVFDRIIYRHDLTYGEYHEALIDYLGLFESYTPPAVVEEYYSVQVEYISAVILHAASLDPETPVYPDDDWLQRPGYPVELAEAFAEASRDLPPEFEAAWNENGCWDNSEPVVIITPESESR